MAAKKKTAKKKTAKKKRKDTIGTPKHYGKAKKR